MQVKAFQIGNRVRTPEGKTGTIEDAGLRPDGTGSQCVKYRVESDTNESLAGWYTGWQLEHA